MRFFIKPGEDVQILFIDSSVYPPDTELWFNSLPKEVQRHLKEEYTFRQVSDQPSEWIQFLIHVMHRNGKKIQKKGARF